jgi:bacillithiol biosynthesis deacetylase BshB1
MVDVLAIMAHPDDAELLCGGTLALAADQGYRTGALDLTGGEAGSAGDATDRSREAAAAAGILGLSARHTAGLPDAALENTPAARTTVAGWIRTLRPTTVILHWHQGRHPDHRVASQLARDACFIAGLRNAPVDGDPHRPRVMLFAQAYREDAGRPSFVVDITTTIDRKLEALYAFGTQVAERTALGEVYGGGGRPLGDQIRAHAAHYGSLIRRPFGEPFWMQETPRVDDVVTLPVSAF